MNISTAQSQGKVLYLCMENFKILKSIPLYEVSNIGNVRRIGSSNSLKPSNQKNGYLALCLYQNNIQHKRYVHRLVAEVFLGDCTNMVINHKDGNKVNNELSNLEIVTSAQNNKHAYATGLRTFTTNQKTALVQSRQKQVLDIETGIFYDSLADGCKFINENYTAIRKRIMRKSKNIRLVYV